MCTYALEMRVEAPKGTWAMVKTLMNGFVPGWTYERPRFSFTAEPETVAKMVRALQPVSAWVVGPYDVKDGPPVGTPIPFPAKDGAGFDDEEQAQGGGTPPAAPATNPARAAMPASQLRQVMAATAPPPGLMPGNPAPAPAAPGSSPGLPTPVAPTGSAAPSPAPATAGTLAPHLTSRTIPTKLPQGPRQVTMPPGHEPPPAPVESVEPRTDGPHAVDAGDGPESASGGMLGNYVTDAAVIGNMREHDYARIASARSLRHKDGAHWIRVGPLSERVYRIRLVNSPIDHGGRVWLVEKKYAEHGGEQLLDRKPTWAEACDAVMDFERALADRLAPPGKAKDPTLVQTPVQLRGAAQAAPAPAPAAPAKQLRVQAPPPPEPPAAEAFTLGFKPETPRGILVMVENMLTSFAANVVTNTNDAGATFAFDAEPAVAEKLATALEAVSEWTRQDAAADPTPEPATAAAPAPALPPEIASLVTDPPPAG